MGQKIRSLKKRLDLSKKEGTLLTAMGFFLLILVFVNKTMHIITWWDFGEILWYCSVASIVLGMSMIFRIPVLVTSVFLTALIAETRWIIDFCLYLFDMSAGRTVISFAESGTIIKSISISLHMLIIPFSGYATFKLGFSKRSIWASLLIFVYVMFAFTFFLTSPEENRNCAFYACDMTYEEALASDQDFFENYMETMVFWTVAASVMYLFLLLLFKRYWPERIVR